ncbi:MAG TPA: hypothetical protein DCW90_24820 [Lachnospiraceae bacterium]|nr:DUF4190 domain-containing protein [uncultured Lachnoclostridium sp.]HAU88578.1 hypothetical protein [Lachnospiraceae bacterium]
MTDEERARFREKAKLRAEAEAKNKEIAPQTSVQMNVQQHPVQDESGQTFTYVTLGCGIAAIVFLFIFGWVSIFCSILGIVMSHMAVTHGYKDNGMRKIGFILSWVALGITIALIVFSIVMVFVGIGLYGHAINSMLDFSNDAVKSWGGSGVSNMIMFLR